MKYMMMFAEPEHHILQRQSADAPAYWAAWGAFAKSLNIPVAHTMTGKGAIPCNEAINAGLFGRYDRIANKLETFIEEFSNILQRNLGAQSPSGH